VLLISGCGRYKPTDSDTETQFTDTEFASDVTSSAPVRGTFVPLNDPIGEDNWEHELIANRVQKRLNAMFEKAVTQLSSSQVDLTGWLAIDAKSSALSPSELVAPRITRTSLGDVFRYKPDQSALHFLGKEAVNGALGDLFSIFQKPGTQFKIKNNSISRVQSALWEAQFLITISKGFSEKEGLEQHMTWKTQWDCKDSEPATMTSIQLIDMERFIPSANDPLYVECTPSIFENASCYQTQFLIGQKEFDRFLPLRRGLDWAGLRGFGLGDANGDGLEDLYICEQPGIPNKLLLQQPNGQLVDVSEQWKMNWIDDARSALFADLDNDGDQDLAVGFFGGVALFRNDSNSGFTLRSVLPTSESVMHLSGADFDMDGRLDLYVCAYNPDELLQDRVAPLPVGVGIEHRLYDSDAGGANSLFRNAIQDDHWEFEDVTEQTGLNHNNSRFSFASSWEDFDNDGDQDLYVANDFGRNCLYRNEWSSDGLPSFTDVAHELNAEDQASGMSVSWGDYNRDGMMDLHIGNMWSSAGLRIIPKSEFNPGIPSDIRDAYHRFALGNSLLMNQGVNGFTDTSEQAGIRVGRWAWASPFVDFNNDGWEDLFVANGYITGHSDSGDL